MLCTSLSHYLSRHIVLFKGITIVGNDSCKGPDSCARKMPDGETTPTNITALSELVFQVGDRSCNGTMSCTCTRPNLPKPWLLLKMIVAMVCKAVSSLQVRLLLGANCAMRNNLVQSKKVLLRVRTSFHA